MIFSRWNKIHHKSSNGTALLLKTDNFLLILDWLKAKQNDPNFEQLPDEDLAQLLRNFFGEVRTKNGKKYSKSSMINLRSDINHYLQLPPNNRIKNLMRDDTFLQANKVFTGQLRLNKEEGLDVPTPIRSIDPADLNKLFDDYFIPGLAKGDTEVLMHSVL